MSSKKENASKWLVKWTLEARTTYISASFLTVLSTACFVGFSWFLSDFAALWLINSQLSGIKLLYATTLIAGRYVFAHFAAIVNYNAGNVIITRIKKQLYPKLLQNNQTDSISSTLLVTRASDDLRPFFSFFIPYLIASVLVSVELLIFAFWFDKWVAFVLLITFLVIPVQMMVIGIGAEALHKKHIDLFMKYSAVFYNRLQTIAEIVNLNNFNVQYRFLSEKSITLNNATTNVMRVAILSSAVLELFVTIAIAAVAIYLGMSLLGIMPGPNYGKGYDFHIALFLLMLTPYFYFYLRKFVSAYHDRNRALAAAKNIMPIFQNEDITFEIDKNEKIQSIKIEKMSFSYPDSAVKVLHNIHINLPSKGLVLVKGISGSGKSTFLKILTGNLRVDEGEISINGHDNEWSQEWLKFNSSYMNQFPFLFDGTLLYNVFLEKTGKDLNDYPAFLDRILTKKEEGWNSELSHNGKQLSGGEKQLLTLARMMLHPRPVAILDEPTANLDSDTVDIILEQILKMSEDRLVIVASHEDKFIYIANKILNLNWGEQITE